MSDLMWVQSNRQKWTLNKNNQTVYTNLTNAVNTLNLKSTPIWWALKTPLLDENQEQTSFLAFTPINNSIWSLIRLQPLNSMFFNVIDLYRSKPVYTAGPGNYILNVRHNKIKKIITFILPSRKQIVTSEWAIGIKGKNTFYLLKNYVSPMHRLNLRLKKISVRGVAKNPVDHHNGGRSNRKPLFLNKYNKVAKVNK